MQGRSGFFVSVKSERVLLAGCGIVGWLLWAVAQEPTVTDGDTIKMAGTTYRLWRIDAPETHQACADGWAAGRISTEYLVNPMHGRRAHATIEVADGSIAGISDTQAAPPSEFAGCFALPGLIDMHVHLPPDNALKLTQGAALLYLLHGVTSIREAGDLDGTAVALTIWIVRWFQQLQKSSN